MSRASPGYTARQTTSGTITFRSRVASPLTVYVLEIDGEITSESGQEDFVIESAAGTTLVVGAVRGGSDSWSFTDGGVLTAMTGGPAVDVMLDGSIVSLDQLVNETGGSPPDTGGGGTAGCSTGDCPPGFECDTASGLCISTDPGGCSTGDCPSGFECNPDTGLCVEIPDDGNGSNGGNGGTGGNGGSSGDGMFSGIDPMIVALVAVVGLVVL